MEKTDLISLIEEKMRTEFEQYRSWLLQQKPEDILCHAYEYSVKDDIICCLEDLELLELTDNNLKALLHSHSPLHDVYKDYCNRDFSYNNEVLLDCVESIAKIACRNEQQRRNPEFRER